MKHKTKSLAWHLRAHRHAKLALWPHKANHYRPHLVRRHGLMAVLALMILGHVFYNLGSGGSVLGVRTTITDAQLLSATNKEREKQGLAELRLSSRLTQAATLKAQDMLEKQYWAHESPAGVTPWHWVQQTGYTYDYAGENLAKNFHTADSTVTAWMASPEHQANVLGAQYNDVGFAVVDGLLDNQETTLVVALYGHEASQAAVPVAVAANNAPVGTPLAPIARLGVAIQSLSPVAVGSMMLLIFVAMVAVAAHLYRRQLPKKLQQSWYRHHGLIKASGLISLCIVVLVLYGGGQI